MTRRARPDAKCDPFLHARGKFDSIVELLSGESTGTHADTEREVPTQGYELMRQLMQAHFDLRFLREKERYRGVPRGSGTEIRPRSRQLESQVGRLVLWRHGIKGRDDDAAHFPLDEQQNLPADLYSHPLRERSLDEATNAAWERTVQQVDKRTGATCRHDKRNSWR